MMPSTSAAAGCRGFALKGLEVTVPETLGVADAAAVVYSLIPWVGALGLLLCTALIRKSYELKLCSALLLSMISMNELLLKKWFAQPRPEGSCLTSHGMPSSHSLLSVGFVVFLVLELRYGAPEHWPRYRNVTCPKQRTLLWTSIILTFVPVPFSRVYLQDHSWFQVGVGVSVGTVLATLFFVSHRAVHRRRRRLRSVGQTPGNFHNGIR